MTTNTPPSGTTPEIESLSKDQCWEMLREQVIGRLAVVDDDHPDIFPINYAVDDGSLVFRTAAGTKLYGSTNNTPVAFEIDGYNPSTEQAWSVVLRGTVLAIRAGAALAEAESLTLEPWQGGLKNHLMRILPLNLSGRRFKVTRPDIWHTPLSDARRASFE
ncbi:Nitroimidazol reductase NimA, pyridoxamine 5'-phosphate oxidase superfamily [Arthrobacter alpinus]|uniref:Nitroimidazol reductase NimA, pyridoxamine 5'-phosphate oxidase superfamily n=1 Tax=Arthrobacter alpinus TaxID=656366 RepID=A0A1H5I2M4_9MICC|nr:pyridoxamine 5'-phosphate oxidase family protein [Arthrobacter alpinus]SEE34457.1 Nitroimidazol reductase NimA, pyridoxamine 5'-phosphate oxidase superfamily [Arthrobacter alpinus]